MPASLTANLNPSLPRRLIRRRSWVGFVALLAVLGGNALWAYSSLQELLTNEARVSETNRVLDELDDILALARDVETGGRGFALTGDERYLEHYNGAVGTLRDRLGPLRQLIHDDTVQFERMPQLQAALRNKVEKTTRLVELRRTRGTEAARAYVLSGAGRQAMNDLRDTINTMKSHEIDRLERRAQISADSAESARATIKIGALANLLLVVAVYLSMVRLRVQHHRLETAYRDLQRAEELRDGLSAMLVHDLRTPLTTMLTPLHMLQSQRFGELDGIQQEFVEMAVGSSERLLRLVNELLDISKLEAGELKPVTEAVDVAALVETAVQQVAKVEFDNVARIHQEISEVNLHVLGDRNLLERVLINLLGNALKFTPGSGSVTVGVKPLENGGDAKTAANWLLFWVHDTGEGIPQADRERIFEKFGQVESRQAGRKASTGLGLTFCKLAVTAHGGRIWVESEIGCGSTFFFTVPAVAEPSPGTMLPALPPVSQQAAKALATAPPG